MTFAQLLERAEAVANTLLGAGVQPEELVGVIMRKGWEQVVAVLGILMAGGAYLPVDADLPDDRVQLLLDLGACRFALTQPAVAPRVGRLTRARVLEIGFEHAVVARAFRQPPAEAGNRLAYVLFTSGSTGEPKGVAMEHGAALASVSALRDAAGVGPVDAAIALSSLSFDPSVFDIFAVLGAGAALVIPDADRQRDPAHWLELIERFRVTHWCSVPLLLDMLVSHLDEMAAAGPQTLRRVILGGDWISPALLDRTRRRLPELRIANVYGPTETCVASTWAEIEPDAPFAPGRVGRALSGEAIIVCDDASVPVPAGAHGEIWIAGAALARGYWRDAAGTASAFRVLAPVTGRAYRTGDRGTLSPDGVLSLLGRTDRQVKLSGVRVELGEIEEGLRAFAGVDEAAVIAPLGEDGVRVPVAWVVARNAHPDLDAVRAHLARLLPAIAVPNTIQVVDALPSTSNGKVDYAAIDALWREMRAPTGARIPEPAVSADRDTLLNLVREVVGTFTNSEVGPDDHFFKVGGNSLAATRVVARLRARLNADVPTRLPFDFPIVREMAASLEQVLASSNAAPLVPVRRRSEPNGPASSGQAALWFLDRLAEGNRAYHAQSSVEFDGELDTSALWKALQALVDRHEIFRTTLHERDGEIVRRVHDDLRVVLDEHDLRSLNEPADRAARAEEVARADARHPFDLSALPLVRWTLFRMGDSSWLLVQTEHHIVHDGWSTAVLWRDVETAYRAALDGQDSKLPEVHQYQDFARWQREHVAGGALQAGLAYWSERLTGSQPTELVMARKRPAHQTFEGDTVRVRIPREVYAALRELAAREQVSLFVVMLAAFVVLLGRHAASSDVTVGTWAANREREEFDDVVGMFVNMVAIRLSLSDDLSVREFLQHAEQALAAALEHQAIPFDQVVRAVGAPRDASRNPLVTTTFSFHDAPMPRFTWPGVSGTFLERHNGSAKFDLNVIGIPRAEQHGNVVGNLQPDEDLQLIWEFNTALLDRQQVLSMTRHYEAVLRGMSAEGVLMRDVFTAGGLDRDVDASTRVGPRWETAPPDTVDAFLTAARTKPAAVAVVDHAGSLTYRELERRVSGLVAALREQGVGPGSTVAIAIDRDAWLPAALLAVLACGAAYLPLDPIIAPARIATACEDAGATVAIVSRSTAALVTGPLLVLLDELDLGVTGRPLAVAATDPSSCAYVLFTSGSTGRPKGVQISRAALSNLLHSVVETIGLRPTDTWLAVTTVAFDIAGLELLAPLIRGGTLVVASSRAAADGQVLRALLEQNVITVMQATPLTWRILAESGWVAQHPLTVLCGGEAMAKDLAHVLLGQRLSAGAEVWNLYGPTETTIWSSAHRVTAADVAEGAPSVVALGAPLHNTVMRVADSHGAPVAAGLPGELLIGGDGVAIGYLDPALTAARFAPIRLGAGDSVPGFRTGDMVAIEANGDLRYLRRLDRQVKLRGYRIEPAEIEAAIRSRADVAQCAVVLRDDPERLVAFVVPASGQTLGTDVLADLRETVPHYMVPALAVQVEDLPRTTAGKLDTYALEVVDLDAVAPPARAQENANSEIEESLCQFWSELLRVPRVGLDDNFFSLGGHSLLALQLVTKVRGELGLQMSLDVVFDCPTVREMAAVLTSSTA